MSFRPQPYCRGVVPVIQYTSKMSAQVLDPNHIVGV